MHVYPSNIIKIVTVSMLCNNKFHVSNLRSPLSLIGIYCEGALVRFMQKPLGVLYDQACTIYNCISTSTFQYPTMLHLVNQQYKQCFPLHHTINIPLYLLM